MAEYNTVQLSQACAENHLVQKYPTAVFFTKKPWQAPSEACKRLWKVPTLQMARHRHAQTAVTDPEIGLICRMS